MALPTIPNQVTLFFAQYNNAPFVFLLANGTVYLSNFEEDAIKKAKSSTTKLYKVNPNSTLALHYPTSFRYELEYDVTGDAITDVEIDGENATPLGMQPTAIKTAFEQALQAGGLTGEVAVVQNGTTLFITVVTSEDTDMSVTDTNMVVYPLVQKFN